MEFEHIDWIHTRSALAELENVLKCVKCDRLVDNPCTLGGCEHFFCQRCVTGMLGENCPVCGIPSHVKDVQPDRQLLTAANLCQKLSRLLHAPLGQSQLAASQTSSPCHERSKGTIEAPHHDDGFSAFGFAPDASSSPVSLRSRRGTKPQNTDSGRLSRVPRSIQSSVKAQTKSNKSKSLAKRNVRQAKQRVSHSPEESSSSETENQEERIHVRSRGAPRTVKTSKNLSTSRTSETRQNNGSRTDIQQESEADSDPADDAKPRSRRSGKAGQQPPEISGGKSDAPGDEDSSSSVPAQVKASTRGRKRGKQASHGPGTQGVESTRSPGQVAPSGRRVCEASASTQGVGKSPSLAASPSVSLSKSSVNSPQSRSNRSRTTSLGTPKQHSKLNSSVTGTPSSSQINRKNAKGETPLHVATIKGEIEVVKKLLREGVKVNVKDNAGWTPLHEACNHGFLEIATLLLDHGAFISVPGMDNDTPLHDAVQNFQMDCVKLLVQRGASLTARNIHGYTPLDLAKTDEMRATLSLPVLESAAANTSTSTNAGFANDRVVIMPTGLPREQKNKLRKCAELINGEMVTELSNKVTHVAVEVKEDGQCPRTIKYLQAILTGKWIVGFSWAEYCLENKEHVCEEAFEIPGATTSPNSGAPRKGRLNAQQQLPSLFSGCHFFFQGEFTLPTPDKDQLIQLVKVGGGEVLSREPRTENISEFPATVPYHVSDHAELANCSYYIIHDKRDEPAHLIGHRICKASAQWLLECIAYFQLDLNSPS